MNSLTYEDLGSAAQRDRRKRILDATIALASKGGFDAVQMRAVAERRHGLVVRRERYIRAHKQQQQPDDTQLLGRRPIAFLLGAGLLVAGGAEHVDVD
jgi:hypothetical protein